MNIFIVDVDGVIADSRWRSEHALAKDWEKFHSLCGDDPPIEGICRVVRALCKENVVILLTGRNESNRRATEIWLGRQDIRVDEILMRPEGNFEPAEILKLKMIDEYFGSREKALAEVSCIFEDSEKNTEAFRNCGFTVLQNTPGIG